MHKARSFYRQNKSALLLKIAFLLAITPSCSENAVIGKTASPDALNQVEIISVENSGPGQNDLSIIVRIKNRYADKFRDISVFNGDGVASPVVSVAWQGKKNLVVTYEKAGIGLQVVKIGNISIRYNKKS